MKGFFNFLGKASIIVAFAAVIACQEKNKPDGLLPQDKMVAVLMDIYVTEQKVSRLGLSSDSAAHVFAIMEKKIFEKHQVSDTLFKASLSYYTDQSKELQKIYGVVIDSLQLDEQRTAPAVQ